MQIEISEKLGASLQLKAKLDGLSVDAYLEKLLQKDLAAFLDLPLPWRPLKTAFGSLAHLGPAPTAEDIDENRAELSRVFEEKWRDF